jgi:23S rRNA (adenine2503-C2)-methyltransferase
LNPLKIVDVQEDEDVNKYLFELSDGEHIEAVLMRHDYGNSVCVSSQVGCNMGCRFCESGRRKKVRNLETYEMVLQILMIEKLLGERISHVVVMGIGEPFDNYDNLIKFFTIINHPKGLAIGARHITVSTCGLVPKILEFSDFPLQINLAVSLHAPNNEIRNQIMPINKAYPIEKVMEALKIYLIKTNRRLTFEYILLKDINDSDQCAIELSKLIKGMNCYVNLIPYNETNNIDFKRTNTVQIMRFYDILKKNNVSVTIRREFGGNISAACGQLRSKKEEL